MQRPASTPAPDIEQAGPPVLTVDGARATIRLNRPRHLNRLQPEDLPVQRIHRSQRMLKSYVLWRRSTDWLFHCNLL